MNKILGMFWVLGLFFAVAPANAEEGRASLGVSAYTLTAIPSSGATKVFTGSAVTGSYDFTSLISVSGHYYALIDNDFSFIELNGFDTMIRLGKNDLGVSYFGAFGYYNETLSAPTVNTRTIDIEGTFVGYGVGYNWESVHLGWEGSFRTSGNESAAPGVTTIAMTSSLNLAYRF